MWPMPSLTSPPSRPATNEVQGGSRQAIYGTSRQARHIQSKVRAQVLKQLVTLLVKPGVDDQDKYTLAFDGSISPQG